MNILTLLTSDRQVARVSAAAPAPHRLIRASSVSVARLLLREQPVDVLVIDPVVGSRLPRVAASAAELFEIGTDSPYLPVVFFVSNAAAALPLIARFPTRERCEAVVATIDDGSREIGRAIEAAAGSSLVARLLRHAWPLLADVPPSLFRTVRHVFTNPRFFRTVDDLAASANMTRRTLDRCLARRGLVSGAELLQAARALHAVRLARDMIVVRDELYAICGVNTPDQLKVLLGDFAGSPARLGAPSDEDLIARFSARLRRR